MKNHIEKYRTDQLTVGELEEVRQKAAVMTDDELATAVEADWMSGNKAECRVSEADKSRIKQNIDGKLGITHNPLLSVWRVVRVAAVIMLPVFIVSTILLYRNTSLENDAELAVCTPAGQHAVATLSDRTVVTLNGNSSISSGGTAGARNVIFEGEAFFDVVHDSKHPFTVTTPNLLVTVLGTRFNLEAREDALEAVLYLEDGLVRLTSSLTGETIEVHPKQRAVLNYADGHISVYPTGDYDNTMAWMSGRLVFNNEPLESVFVVMGKYYDCEFRVDRQDVLSDRFTGTIPTDDIDVASAILEKTFGIKLNTSLNKAKHSL